MGANHGENFGEQPLAVHVDLEDDFFERLLGRVQVVKLRSERDGTGFQFVELGERFHVDVTEPAELATEFLDFVGGGSGVQRRDGVHARLRLTAKQFGQLDLIIIAQTLHQRIAMMAQIGRLQFALMDALLMRSPLGPGGLGLLRKAGSLTAFALAIFVGIGNLPLRMFLRKIRLGKKR